jgi:hypothetical protein
MPVALIPSPPPSPLSESLSFDHGIFRIYMYRATKLNFTAADATVTSRDQLDLTATSSRTRAPVRVLCGAETCQSGSSSLSH